MSIAVVSAYNTYFREHPLGVSPSYGFLQEFLKDFVDCELLQKELDMLHGDWQTLAKREREMLERLKLLRAVCIKKASASGSGPIEFPTKEGLRE
jgi:hypothetical protein